MSTETTPGSPPPDLTAPRFGREFWWRAAHVFLLSGVAIAYPLLDKLGRGEGPSCFVSRRIGGVGVVAFGLMLVLLVPLALVAVEAVAELFRPAVRHWVHLAIVATLLVLVFLFAVKKATTSALWIGVGTLLGTALLTFGYARLRELRDVLNWLTPVPLVLFALFVFSSEASALVFPRNSATAKVKISSTTPVVFALLDEFPSQSLMDSNYQIDAKRFPNIAAFAKQSYWFRNATTVDDFTPYAVPSLLSGKRPPEGPEILATAANHPNNLFTLLGPTYTFHVQETVTHLCPPKYCPEETGGGPTRARRIAEDAGALFLHQVLPPRFESSAPTITNTCVSVPVGPTGLPASTPSQLQQFQKARFQLSEEGKLAQFIGAIDDRPASLYFTHFFLPHHPWRRLPTGQSFPIDDNTYYPEGWIAPQGGGIWGGDQAAIHVALQRHLLQVGYVDYQIGLLVAKLKQVGIYDKALIVLASDHGASFVPNTDRRRISDKNAYEIFPTTVLIKAPGQTRGVVSDRNVQTIDVVPTMAEMLHFTLPYPVDGVSAIDPNLPAPDEKLLKSTERGVLRLPGARPARFRLADEINATFPHRSDAFDLYAFGPAADLVGKPASAFPIEPGPAPFGRFDHPEMFDKVDPSASTVPAYASGGVRVGTGPDPIVALALNGRIVATVQTFLRSDNKVRFSLFYPPSVLARGKNVAQLYLVHRSAGQTRLLPVAP